eukprot:scaffold17_cov354-Pavlova_lutheri.AAC.7
MLVKKCFMKPPMRVGKLTSRAALIPAMSIRWPFTGTIMSCNLSLLPRSFRRVAKSSAGVEEGRRPLPACLVRCARRLTQPVRLAWGHRMIFLIVVVEVQGLDQLLQLDHDTYGIPTKLRERVFQIRGHVQQRNQREATKEGQEQGKDEGAGLLRYPGVVGAKEEGHDDHIEPGQRSHALGRPGMGISSSMSVPVSRRIPRVSCSVHGGYPPVLFHVAHFVERGRDQGLVLFQARLFARFQPCGFQTFIAGGHLFHRGGDPSQVELPVRFDPGDHFLPPPSPIEVVSGVDPGGEEVGDHIGEEASQQAGHQCHVSLRQFRICHPVSMGQVVVQGGGFELSEVFQREFSPSMSFSDEEDQRKDDGKGDEEPVQPHRYVPVLIEVEERGGTRGDAEHDDAFHGLHRAEDESRGRDVQHCTHELFVHEHDPFPDGHLFIFETVSHAASGIHGEEVPGHGSFPFRRCSFRCARQLIFGFAFEALASGQVRGPLRQFESDGFLFRHHGVVRPPNATHHRMLDGVVVPGTRPPSLLPSPFSPSRSRFQPDVDRTRPEPSPFPSSGKKTTKSDVCRRGRSFFSPLGSDVRVRTRRFGRMQMKHVLILPVQSTMDGTKDRTKPVQKNQNTRHACG